MVIISPFKDYYDFVVKQYGGGDPRIVYERNRILESQIEIDFNIPLISLRYGINDFRNAKKYAYLIVAGKAYMLSKPFYDIAGNVNDYRIEINPMNEDHPYWIKHQLRDMVFDKEQPALVKLCRIVCHPVFVIHDLQGHPRRNKIIVSVYEQCPILQKLGMASIMSAQQMYQELSYFIGNLMKESPDIKPPVRLTEKQRIVKAGFDLVKSFRHRM